MIINTSKLVDITKATINITDGRPYIYFLFNITDKTPRYKRENNEYVIDSKGKFVIDEGFDLFKKRTRVLKYIGQTLGRSIGRILVHYYFDNNDLRNKKIQHGTGPVFTHYRLMKIPRFIYDTVRLHHETLLVRKYLPEINKSSSKIFSDVQKMIILNSEGKIKISDIIYPYKLHARDIWLAAKAFKNEDWEWVKQNCAVSKQYKHLTIADLKSGRYSFGENFWMGKVRGKKSGQKRGKKKQFSRWFRACVLFKHNKQLEAKRSFQKKIIMLRNVYGDKNFDKQLTLFHEKKSNS
jgi:hypothetical protein